MIKARPNLLFLLVFGINENLNKIPITINKKGI